MTTQKVYPHEKDGWNGYTLDELRYMRAYTAARLEIKRDRLRNNIANVKNIQAFPAKGIFGKILNTMSYLDIAVMTYRVGTRVFKLVSRLRRK